MYMYCVLRGVDAQCALVNHIVLFVELHFCSFAIQMLNTSQLQTLHVGHSIVRAQCVLDQVQLKKTPLDACVNHNEEITSHLLRSAARLHEEVEHVMQRCGVRRRTGSTSCCATATERHAACFFQQLNVNKQETLRNTVRTLCNPSRAGYLLTSQTKHVHFSRLRFS